MATKKGRKTSSTSVAASSVSSSIDEMLFDAVERSQDGTQTGRYLLTFKEGAARKAIQSLGAQGMRVADARDFDGQAAVLEDVGDADALVLSEIGVALVGGDASEEFRMSAEVGIAADSPLESIEPEHFVFVNGGFCQPPDTAPAVNPGEFTQTMPDTSSEYMRGFLRAAETIARDLEGAGQAQMGIEEEVQVVGATWGLKACKVPPSTRSGAGIKVAVLGVGMDTGHPDFAGRSIVTQSFVGQPVQDLLGYDTHAVGTACGPKAPPGTIQRYGIGYKTNILIGKVLSNSGAGTTATILSGMNWAIANRCPVIFTYVGAGLPPQPVYTAAGQAALNHGCLIIAGAGSGGGQTGAPANSPTIMSVAALNQQLAPAPFSNFGKIDIAAPGQDIFSAWARPTLYGISSGTSTAAAHVAGCAALWAESSASLRGVSLRNRLQATARSLPFPVTRVGAGLVQAP